MLINSKQADERLNSPMNLMNRLKTVNTRKSAMSLFIPPRVESFNPFTGKEVPSANESSNQRISVDVSSAASGVEHPLENTSLSDTTLDTILENHDSQIRLGLAHDNALNLLNSSVNALALKLEDVKADKLPSVISAASKVVESIRKERNERSKSGADSETHYHFYVPEQKKLASYEVIDVTA